MSEQDSFKTQRKVLKSAITRIINFVNNFDPTTGNEFDLTVREEQLNNNFDKYLECQSQLEILNYEAHQADRPDVEDKVFTALSKIKTIKLSMQQTTNKILVNSAATTCPTAVKLPNIHISTFNGKTEQWKTFLSLFTATINNNAQLDNVQKFYYLKSFLADEPLALINELELTSDNYSKALDILKKRYDNKLLTINHHLKSLLEMLPIGKANAINLREFVTTVNQHVNALKSLSLPIEHWDVVLVYILCKKLDVNTHKSFELERDSSCLPTFNEFLQFLEKRAAAFENVGGPSFSSNKPCKVAQINVNQNNSQVPSSNNVRIKRDVNSFKQKPQYNKNALSKNCLYCANKQHSIFSCSQFIKLQDGDKLKFINSIDVCHNCFSKTHQLNQCTARSCWVCGKKHHTILHDCFATRVATVTVPTTVDEPSASTSQTSIALNNIMSNQVLLATALVNIKISSDKTIVARCLLDSASQVSFITKEFFNKIQSQIFKQSANIFGLSGNKTVVHNYTKLNFISQYNKRFHFQENCAIVDNITLPLPHIYIDKTVFHIPAGVFLADKHFNVPGKIDILLGASVYYSSLKEQIIHLGKGLPVLQHTQFGYTVAGNFLNNQQSNNFSTFTVATISNVNSNDNNSNLDEILLKFWQVEEVSNKHSVSYLNQTSEAEKLFLSSISYKQNKFQVNLPFKSNVQISELDGSYEVALRRFKLLERRFTQNTELFIQYKQFINEYVALGHAKYVDIDFSNPSHLVNCYFMPHQAVFKVSSSTKIRVVFDASAKSTNGKSLNDLLHAPPPPQRDIFDLLINLRCNKYVFTTDIQKMYRQILIAENDKKFQRILWRENQLDTLKCLELQTVTYGTSSAPFLAVSTIRYLAETYKDRFPLAAQVLLNDCYVDDIMTGADSLDMLYSVKNELVNLLHIGGFELHKWCANNKDFLNTIPKERHESLEVHFSEGNNVIKTLGLFWDPSNDIFKISFSNNYPQLLTKRNILSFIARIYDPLGIIGPIITPFKIFMQNLWCTKINWDTEIPIELQNKWNQLISYIDNVKHIYVPRWLKMHVEITSMQLHGFSDASNLCYGAVVYLRCQYANQTVSVRLISSKSRVSPLKKVTLPRLELLGAVILSRLTKKLLSIIPFKINEIYLWSDSTIVLSWINSDPSRWNTFVSNRIAEIQNNVPTCQWCYINTKENPADCLSRGLDASKLINFSLWFEGPTFLKKLNFIPELFTQQHLTQSNTSNFELKNIISMVNTSQNFDDSILRRSSNYNRLIRTIAYCFRFIQKCKKSPNTERNEITVTEYNNALTKIIYLVQHVAFFREISLIQNNQSCKNTKLESLNPFLDNNNLLRVGGRLKLANIDFSQKHPIILPAGHHFTRLLIEYEHKRLCHTGPQNLLSNLRLQYWPMGGRREVKKILRTCLRCFRFRASGSKQIMADLPPSRVTMSRPYQNVGVDMAGPFLTKQSRIRKSLQTKSYVALFICLATKAVHLELVSDMSADKFLFALKRFVSRRGFPSLIISDNGTNFHGTKNQLTTTLHNLISNNDSNNKVDLNWYLVQNKITWKFITPGAPHHGGIWEANIKSMKKHLIRVLGTVVLTYEETYTVLCQIEAVLNSRPLVPLSENPDDLNYLTPGHFLVNSNLTALPETNYTETPINRLKFWELCCKLHQSFWKKWHVEYLHNLQSRHKWFQCFENIKLNTMVLMIEENVSPLHWPIGRIVKIIESPSDKKVRSVEIRTERGVYRRPITKIAPLPFQSSDD